MKEDLESPLPIVIIKEWVWIAMEIHVVIRHSLFACTASCPCAFLPKVGSVRAKARSGGKLDSYSSLVICLPRASPQCFLAPWRHAAFIPQSGT